MYKSANNIYDTIFCIQMVSANPKILGKTGIAPGIPGLFPYHILRSVLRHLTVRPLHFAAAKTAVTIINVACTGVVISCV